MHGRPADGTPELSQALYQELRAIAASYMQRERAGHTLQPTALVNEAYIRLAGFHSQWQGKTHFLSMAATTMRRILVEHARQRLAGKRGSGATKVTLDDDVHADPGAWSFDVLALDAALEDLAQLSERQARTVELRYFAGLSVEETAVELAVSPRTVNNETRVALAWLRKSLA